MAREPGGRAIAVALALLALAVPSWSGPIPSKAPEAPSLEESRAPIEVLLARDDVARALAAHGLSSEEVERRIAQLSPQDMAALANNLEQIQAAGEVPQYIWILLAILIGVTIIVTIF